MIVTTEKIRILTAHLAPHFVDAENLGLLYNWSVSNLEGYSFLFTKEGKNNGNRLEVDAELGLYRNGTSPALLESLHACLAYMVGEKNLVTETLPIGMVQRDTLTCELRGYLIGRGDKHATHRLAGRISSALLVNLRKMYFTRLYETGQPPSELDFGYYLPDGARSRLAPFFSLSLIEVISTFPTEPKARYRTQDRVRTNGISETSLNALREACRIILEKETQHV